MDRPPSAGPVRVIDLLGIADRMVGVCLDRAPTTATLTREQWRTLVLLGEGVGTDGVEPPGHSMGEIAARAGVPAPTATRMVDRLIVEGLAYRRSDDWDRRRVLVHLSPEGGALMSRAAAELDDAFGAVLSDLGSSDRVDLMDLFERMHRDVSSVEGIPAP